MCKDGPLKIFKLTCGHLLCVDDLRGYVESALGDVSMFPVKCPMHYEVISIAYVHMSSVPKSQWFL